MKSSKLLIAFVLGCVCSLGAGALLAADNPSAPRDVNTQIIPVMGGLEMLLSITKHSESKTYLYLMPQKKDEPFKLLGSIDLTSVGDEKLRATLEWPEYGSN